MPIGFHETISAPHMHATCRECRTSASGLLLCLMHSATPCSTALCTEAGWPVPTGLPTPLYVLRLQWSCCGNTSLKGRACWMWGQVRVHADLAVGTTAAAACCRRRCCPLLLQSLPAAAALPLRCCCLGTHSF